MGKISAPEGKNKETRVKDITQKNKLLSAGQTHG